MKASTSSCSGVICPVGDLDPHHLVVAALALAVDALVQPEDAEHVLFDLAREVLGDGLLEDGQLLVDLGFEGSPFEVDNVYGHAGLHGRGAGQGVRPGGQCRRSGSARGRRLSWRPGDCARRASHGGTSPHRDAVRATLPDHELEHYPPRPLNTSTQVRNISGPPWSEFWSAAASQGFAAPELRCAT